MKPEVQQPGRARFVEMLPPAIGACAITSALVWIAANSGELAGPREIAAGGVIGCICGAGFVVAYVYGSFSGLWMPLVAVLAGFASSFFLERKTLRSTRDHHFSALAALALGLLLFFAIDVEQRELYLYFVAAVVPLGGMLVLFGSWIARVLMTLRRRLASRRALTPS